MDWTRDKKMYYFPFPFCLKPVWKGKKQTSACILAFQMWHSVCIDLTLRSSEQQTNIQTWVFVPTCNNVSCREHECCPACGEEGRNFDKREIMFHYNFTDRRSSCCWERRPRQSPPLDIRVTVGKGVVTFKAINNKTSVDAVTVRRHLAPSPPFHQFIQSVPYAYKMLLLPACITLNIQNNGWKEGRKKGLSIRIQKRWGLGWKYDSKKEVK